MKVLHVGEYVNGGVATYLKTLSSESEKYGVDTYLLMSDYKSEKTWAIDPNKVFFYTYKRGIFHIFVVMKTIHQYIKKINPDVIHAHSTWAGVFVRFPYLLKKKKVKIIYSSHGWAFLMDVSPLKKTIYAFIERVLSFVTDKIINISQYEQDKAIQYGLNKKKMVMIYNGVVGVKAVEGISVERMNKEKINLLFVGRIDHQKGLDIFMKTYYQDTFTDIHLYVIGKSVLDDVQLKNDDKTTYLGWVKNEDIDAYYQACDVVIMPSRWEGFGLVAIEAMRNRKPVIASNRGALPEIVQNGITGYIFDLNKNGELEEILFNLRRDKLKSMGEKAYKRYMNMFTEDRLKDNTYKIYKL